ncbi:zinc-ribbon domain-containing protein [Levilactobacillus lindianensis]|uniref:zinc-ribbon domain-containing protein n=1 Tax=Levilactobacillus lindianensis TaxID=2486018 RepID=UPI0013DDB9E7|nr:zinc-ribbon domain-containing protein [Levilactobacillus lindianensis]
MKFCINCGQQLKAGQKFCTHCGAKQPEFTQPVTPASSAAPVPPQATPVAPTQEQATPVEPPVEPEVPLSTSDAEPPVSQASAPVTPDVAPIESPVTPSVDELVTPTDASTTDAPEQPATPNVNAPAGQTAGDTGVSGSPTQTPQQPGTSTTGTTAPNSSNPSQYGQVATQPATTAAQTVAKAAGDSRTIWVVVGAIVLILIGVAGYNGYNTYKRDNLTEQEIANIGDGVTSKYLGNSTTVRYSKSDNVLTVEADEDTDLYDIAYDMTNGYDEADDMAPYLTKLKKISTAMAPLMPTNLKDVRVELLNPQNTNLHLYTAEDGDIIYDFTDDE